MPEEQKCVVFLMIQGYFAKRISLYLLSKKLCTSIDQLYRGETNEQHLVVVCVDATPQMEWISQNPSEPYPSGVTSNPIMRVDNLTTGKTVGWVHESQSIIQYLEEMFPGGGHSRYRQMIPTSLLDRAVANDVRGALESANGTGARWMDNASEKLAFYHGFPETERSKAAAKFAKKQTINHYQSAQSWAADNLAKTGWLTPAADGGVGIYDIVLASSISYMKSSWDIFMIEDESLGPLRAWYNRFQKLDFWDEFESRFPDEVRFGPGSVEEV